MKVIAPLIRAFNQLGGERMNGFLGICSNSRRAACLKLQLEGTIFAQIKIRRKQLNVSQQELADRIGVPKILLK
ncbi:helix-turn-helix domain-containing protein [Anoxybacillus kestanbolensis]|uniref:helix-turn-helix domain-containing protein n=1 Tax=Anoxybacillus kestanbolensis TaxID=227476 RepID=UPI00208DCAB3|nr:helix-turn-helix domain-containing protein [Anoxybacillus kestanbolensis]MCL9971684.1 helix-turn-helix domain-containing protein [Anoxybacillus kestanbolensis]